MKQSQDQKIIGFYSIKDKYIRSELFSKPHQTVYTKENDKNRWLVLEQKSKSEIEVRQTDGHGKIIAWDHYEISKAFPALTGMERVCGDGNGQISFDIDEINLIDQYGGNTKTETCTDLSAILPHIKDDATGRIVGSTLKKLESLPEETCMELISTIKSEKAAERDRSILAGLAKAKAQIKKQEIKMAIITTHQGMLNSHS